MGTGGKVEGGVGVGAVGTINGWKPILIYPYVVKKFTKQNCTVIYALHINMQIYAYKKGTGRVCTKMFNMVIFKS